MHSRNITASQLAAAVGCRPIDLITLRRARMIIHIGEKDGRNVLYSIAETAEIGIAFFLYRHGLRQGMAFALAKEHREQIAEALSAGGETGSFLTIIIDRHLADGFAAAPRSSGEDGTQMGNAEALLVLNLSRVVGDVLARLAEATKVSAA